MSQIQENGALHSVLGEVLAQICCLRQQKDSSRDKSEKYDILMAQNADLAGKISEMEKFYGLKGEVLED